MSPVEGDVASMNHYYALADYGCGREGAHVFFFLKRQIVYGGQIVGNKNYGCFYLNGPYCPIGKTIGSQICWDESFRTRYSATMKNGVFKVPTRDGLKERCQPYLIKFRDEFGIKGNVISSDDLYFEIGSYPYPLPSNSIRGMSFCTLTPAEVNILLTLLSETPDNIFKKSVDEIEFTREPLLFEPKYGISNVTNAISEAHLESSILANPELLPPNLRPEGATLCRQVPISPYKPYQMDRADVCYYTDEPIRDGTLPNKVIELKNARAGKGEITQIVRYLKWFHKVIPDEVTNLSFYIFAPSFTRNIWNHVPRELQYQIELVSFRKHQMRLKNI